MPNLPPRLHFDSWEVHVAERRLVLDGVVANVGARAFDVLLTLIESPDRVVTKAELMDRVWAGLVVEENNLPTQVCNLRKVLGSGVIATIQAVAIASAPGRFRRKRRRRPRAGPPRSRQHRRRRGCAPTCPTVSSR